MTAYPEIHIGFVRFDDFAGDHPLIGNRDKKFIELELEEGLLRDAMQLIEDPEYVERFANRLIDYHPTISRSSWRQSVVSDWLLEVNPIPYDPDLAIADAMGSLE